MPALQCCISLSRTLAAAESVSYSTQNKASMCISILNMSEVTSIHNRKRPNASHDWARPHHSGCPAKPHVCFP